MSNVGDFPRINPRPRPSRKRQLGIGAFVAIVFIVISVFRKAAIFYTDFLWFQSVHFTGVWSGMLLTKIVLALIAGVVFFALIWINLWVVDRYAPRSIIPMEEDDVVVRWNQFVAPRRRLVRAGISVVLALFAGISLWTSWSQYLLFKNGGSFGVKDPEFGKDVGFFVFKLPFLNTLVTWAFTALIFCLIVTLIAHYLSGAIPSGKARVRITSAAKVHICALLGLLAVVRAAQYYLRRFELSFSTRGVTTGANYTDVNFLLPALWFLILVSLAAGVVVLISSRQRGLTLPVITVVLWGVVSLLITAIIPAGVQRLSVKPAENRKELPYIERNIKATRAALGLDKIQSHNYQYTSDLNAQDLQNNAQTIRNVRLWDPNVLQPSYQRLQETRSFFQFDNVDVDRYPLNNETTQVMLSLRELNLNQLPAGRKSWVNERLQYTHGYGAVVSPANAVTVDGKPDFTLKDVPPVGTPQIAQPQIYFGETQATSNYSIVGTGQPEIDFVSTDGKDQTSAYHGSGGVPLSNVVKKAAFAARVGDLDPLISGLVGPNSKAMYNTNIHQRVAQVAPFLRFDNDPYPVIIDGHIKWIQDAYTVSNRYPYGQSADTSLLESNSELRNTDFNYIRNSVKIVTDAYDGNMTFYVVDHTDPVVKAWSKAFPKLFTSDATMPAELRSHLRFPEDLFKVQTQMFGRYHMVDATDFYSQSDRWNIAQDPPKTPSAIAPQSTVNAAGQVVQANEPRIAPYYLLMKLPGENDERFISFQPYVPYSTGDQRKELSAFMTVQSDPGSYGQMDVFVMPRDQQVDGPALIDARINQEPTIASQISLLNRQGSSVEFGDMLIIPMENSLLYVRPLYVTAQSTRVPEFKAAIVVQGNKIAMENTLQEALSKIFGSAPQTLEKNTSTAPVAGTNSQTGGGTTTTPTTTAPSTTTGTLPPNAQDLLNQANDQFAQADQALRNSDLAGYQDHVKQGVDLVKKARGQ